MRGRNDKLSEADGDAVSLARVARPISVFWPVFLTIVGVIVWGTRVESNVSGNSKSIDQIGAARGAEALENREWRQRLDERTRRIEEMLARVEERVKR